MDMKNMLEFGESLGLKMWMGTVPVKEKLPAIAYSHVGDDTVRDVHGDITGTIDFWSLIIVANDYNSAKMEYDKLFNADNKDSDFYETFHVTGKQLLIPDEGDSIFRIATDIKTT